MDCTELFGTFHGTFNNCQNYTNLLSRKLEVSTEWTDAARVVGIGGASLAFIGTVALAAVGLVLGVAKYSRRKKN